MKMVENVIRSFAAVAAATIAVGCSSGGSNVPDAVPPLTGTGDFIRTVVTHDANGKQTVVRTRITPADFQADLASRRANREKVLAAKAIGTSVVADGYVDYGSCGVASTLWLTDTSCTAMSGDELCLQGSDPGGYNPGGLSSFCYNEGCTETWSGRVNSMFPGSEDGWLGNSSGAKQYFYADDDCSNTNSVGHAAGPMAFTD